VDRLACVDLPAFSLQLLCRRHPDWARHPVAVVEEDRPQGLILAVNEQARRARILPGHRYAHALSLAPDLRAGEVPDSEIARGVAFTLECLRTFSPNVDPFSGEPGVFWLDATGLGKLYRSLGTWAGAVRRGLEKHGFASTVVVGSSRFATYAVARERLRAVTVFDQASDERDAARRVALERLDLAPSLRDSLAKLGVTTLGGFLRLPPGGLLERFGNEAYRLHRLAAGERWDPLQAAFPDEPNEQRLILDDPETDTERLLFTIKQGLDPLLARLAETKSALACLFIEYTLYRADPPTHLDALRPAEPTLDARALLRLIHLRLESSPPPAGVIEIQLSAEDVLATQEQLSLFRQRPRRDLRAANQAFARLRAELGNDAVVKATLRDGHLPEASFGWEPLEEAVLPNAEKARAQSGARPLVRRIHNRPRMLPPQNRMARDDGWLLRGLEHGPVVRVVGPYIVSGGWWMGEVHREYHFAETRQGECLWVYYDRRRRRWFLQGQVA